MTQGKDRRSYKKHPFTTFRTWTLVLFTAFVFAVCGTAAFAQSGSVSGSVTDSSGGRLRGAQVQLDPGGYKIASDATGQFLLLNVAPGSYKVKVSFLGFKTYEGNVTIVAGQAAQISAVLAVANATEEVLVTPGRARGEAEAINQELTSENILQVLPHDIITSLPLSLIHI